MGHVFDEVPDLSPVSFPRTLLANGPTSLVFFFPTHHQQLINQSVRPAPRQPRRVSLKAKEVIQGNTGQLIDQSVRPAPRQPRRVSLKAKEVIQGNKVQLIDQSVRPAPRQSRRVSLKAKEVSMKIQDS